MTGQPMHEVGANIPGGLIGQGIGPPLMQNVEPVEKVQIATFYEIGIQQNQTVINREILVLRFFDRLVIRNK